MAAVILTIADALVTALNAAVFTAPYADITAVRDFTPRYTFSELADLKVTVIPSPDLSLIQAARGLAEGDFTLGVAIQKKPSELTQAAIDALILLCEEIALYCLDLNLGVAQAVSVEFAPLYEPAILREERTFSGVMLVTFKQIVSL